MRHALVLVALLLSATSARADVVPDGQRYVPVAHTLSGTASLKGYKLYLVTLNRRMRNHVSVSPDVGDGALAVPGGYMAYSQLVALTPPQVAELDEARAGKWSDEPGEHTAPSSKLREFFERKDLASSNELGFRGLVDEGSDTRSITRAWTVVKVEGNDIVMTLPEPERSLPVLPFVVGGGLLVALALAFVLVRRRKPGVAAA